jgi:Protein of unknown function (DUF2786)
MELNRVLELVRKLVAKAESTDSPDEARALSEQADNLMIKYAIDEAALDASRPPEARAKPAVIEIELTGYSGLLGWVAALAASIARHCGCRVRQYNRYHDGAWRSKVYGYESDLRYFEIMYTTLRLHMIGALRPRPDSALSLEDNVFSLHSAGLNWFDIAKLYGWYQVMPLPGEPRNVYINRNSGDRVGWSKSIGQYKRAYARACEARGVPKLHVPPSGGDTFRRSAAQGYVSRLDQRLREIRGQRVNMNALALRVSDLDEFFRAENPDLFEEPKPSAEVVKSKGRPRKDRPLPFSESAYGVGVGHANTASLDPAPQSSKTKAIR